MSDNERHLLEKAKNGDIQAFEQLIEGYQKRVFNIALRMVGNHEDASELAQEVFIKVFKSIKSFKEESQFSTWLYRVTTNVCLDELRKRKRNNTISLDEELQTDDGVVKRQIEDNCLTPEMTAEKNEMKRAIKEAIELLPEDQRVVIVLRDINGFSYEEISNFTNCPEGTVKSRINRARNTLREILKTKRELFSEHYVKLNRKEGWR